MSSYWEKRNDNLCPEQKEVLNEYIHIDITTLLRQVPSLHTVLTANLGGKNESILVRIPLNLNHSCPWLLIDDEKRNKEEWQIKLTYICMKSLTNVWIVVENWHSMAKAISIYMSYAKDVVRVSIMIKSLVTNTIYWDSVSTIILPEEGWFDY
jgi:hypothetical protein